MWSFRRRAENDFRDEIRTHIALETDRLIEDGVPPDDARHAATRAFGNVTTAEERFYESRRWLWLEALRQDVGYAARIYWRSPGFAAAAILTLALGIGATSAVFTMADHMLFRPLPYPDADRLVRVTASGNAAALAGSPRFVGALHLADYLRARASHTGFEYVTHPRLVGTTALPGSGQPSLVYGIDDDFLPALGVHPWIGRVFAPAEYRIAADTAGVALVTAGVWQRAFGGRPDILDQYVELPGRPARRLRIVGVLPPTFVFPDHTNQPPDIFIPAMFDPADAGRPNVVLAPIARVKADTSHQAAAAEMQAIVTAVERDYPAFAVAREVRLTPLQQSLFGQLRMPLVMLLAATGCVLVLACANLAHLFMTRLHTRRREIGVRMALGSSAWRLLRQLAVEALMLAAVGGIASLAVAHWTLQAIMAQTPVFAHVYRLLPATVDGRIAAFAFLLVVTTLVVFGLLPAIVAARGDVRTNLSDEAPSTWSRKTMRAQRLLVMVQAGVAVALLVTSALVVQSFVRLAYQPLGFKANGVRVLSADPPPGSDGAATFQVQRAVYEHLRESLQLSAAMADGVPAMHLSGLVGRPEQAPDDWSVAAYGASGTLFDVLEMQLLRGRLFSDREAFGSAPVAVVDEAAAAQLWPDQDPLGQPLAAADGTIRRVIGVVRTLRLQLRGDSTLAGVAVVPLTAMRRASVLLTGDLPASAVEQAQRVAASVVPGTAVTVTAPLAVFERELGEPRFLAALLGALGFLTGVLAFIGILGVVSFQVARRWREIGIRLTFGADPGRIRWMVLRDTLVPALVGVTVGLCVTVWWASTLRLLLHGVPPTDPTTIGSAAGAVGLIVGGASVLAARRATKMDPLVTLRYE